MGKSLKDLQKDLHEFNSKMKKLDEAAPRIGGVEALRWIHNNFQKESYKGKKWEPRSAKTNKGYDKRNGVKGSVFNSANPILRQTGNLHDALRYRVVNRIAFVGFDTNRVPYGVVHNEGGRIVVGQRRQALYFYAGRFAAPMKGKRRKKKEVIIKQTEIKMPQRQFMPRPNEPTEPDILIAVGKKINFERERIFSIFKK